MNLVLEYAGHHTLLVAASAAVALIIFAYEVRQRAEGRGALTPQEIIRLMNHGALVLDLRPAEQFATGHIAGARRVSGEEILKAGDSLKRHREKAVIVYCDSGTRGAAAARQLTAQGFKNAFSLRGGLAAWRSENLPLSKA